MSTAFPIQPTPLRCAGGLVWLLLGLFCVGPAVAAEPHEAKNGGFDANVRVALNDDAMIVSSDGIPTHKTGTFPSATNPNRILKQDYRFYIPRNPRKAEKPTPTPFGPIGVANNGIPFYNPYNAQGRDAVFGPNAEVFDSCCGHPDPMGRYHYHKYPVCVKSPFRDEAGAHSPRIGYAFDGFAIHGPNGSDGRAPGDLDECNGHSDAERGYHYHVTDRFPYLIGAYRGVADERNFDRPRFGGPGGRGQGGGPAPPPALVALDQDRDGTISADELARATAALLSLDRDGDGALSSQELMPPRPGMDGRPRPDGPPPGPPSDDPGRRRRRPGGPGVGAGGPPPPPPTPLLDLLDADRDGSVSAAELKRAPAALRTLDRDRDGTLSREELRPPGPPRPGGPPGRRPPFERPPPAEFGPPGPAAT